MRSATDARCATTPSDFIFTNAAPCAASIDTLTTPHSSANGFSNAKKLP